MDDEDDSAALAHQMELEQRQQEEEAALNRGRRILAVFRWRNQRFERETKAHTERVRSMK
jgi:hypothetical protein